MELSDLFYEYPSVDNSHIQQIISSKKELKILGDEKLNAATIPSRGNFYPQQRLIHRILTHYDRLLITSEPGTGKTGMTAGFAEKLKRDNMDGIKSYVDEYISDNRSHYKRVYILLKNESLVDQWTKEIVCKYSNPEDYESEHIKNAPTKKAEKRRINDDIKKYYTITTYEKFAKNAYQISEGGGGRKWGDMVWTRSPDHVKKAYSDSVFIVDEVHNLGNDDEELEDDRNIDKVKQKKKNNARLKDKIYNALHFLFHIIDRSKVILMSATPMINFPNEIGPIMNLILPINKQMPADKLFYKVIASDKDNGITEKDINIKKEELRKYFEGYISYVAESKETVVPKYMGDSMDKEYYFHNTYVKSKEIIYKVRMTNAPLKLDGKKVDGYNQYQSYNKEKQSKRSKKSAFNAIERQAANMTFPNGTTGTKGASTYIKEEKEKKNMKVKKGKGKINKYTPTDEFKPWLKSKENLRQLSAKFVRDITLIEEAKGNVFVFSPFRVGSGAYLFGMCLEYISKYKLFSNISTIFIDDTDRSNINYDVEQNAYCGTTSIHTNNINVVIKKERKTKSNIYKSGSLRSNGQIEPYKYAIITSNMTKELIANIISTYNSYENRHGEYIKCIIATPKARESINLFNVIRYINLGPGWNGKLMKQSKYRVFRSGSHKDLIYEKEQKYINMGIIPSDKDLQVEVEIYNMAIETPDGGSTVDEEMYVLSEKKDISIGFIETIMREDAIDCQIMSRVNTKSKEGTNEEYICSGDIPNTVRIDSYNNLYSNDVIKEIKIKIKSIFKRLFSIPIHDLYNSLGEYDQFLIDSSIYELINSRDLIIDMYGFPKYFRETNNYIYITSDYLINKHDRDYILDYYSKNRSFIYETSLSDYYDNIKDEIYDSIEDLENIGFDEWQRIFFSLPDKMKLKNFEKITYKYLHDENGEKKNENYKRFANKFGIYIHYMYIPVDLLQKTKNAIASRGTGKGRKASESSIPVFSRLKYPEGRKNKLIADEIYIPTKEMADDELDDDVSNDIIYMHTFNQELQKKKLGANSRTSKFGVYDGNIRILVSNGEMWRDSDLSESLLYNPILNLMEKEKTNEFTKKKYEFVGIVSIYPSETNKLWIRMISNDKGKKRNKGKRTKSYTIPEIYYFMWYMEKNIKKRIKEISGIDEDSPTKKYSNEIRTEKMKLLENKKLDGENLKDYSDERLDFYLSLSQKGIRSDTTEPLLREIIINFGNVYYV
uniref:Early transcription factor 70 kDa subunit n=1 Tax=Pithovirus LCPAC101 TaxID=2506586 RepID=A0A481Z2L4_9VIRU|nr:MAG: uncharacterized protein LCPAC101_02260 [Pithovirus LCPAC101]